MWGHCSQVLVLLTFGARKRGVTVYFFVPFFPASGNLGTPPNSAKQGKTQNDKSTLFYNPTYRGNGSIYLHRGRSLLQMALTGQRIAMVDMVFLVFTAFPYLP